MQTPTKMLVHRFVRFIGPGQSALFAPATSTEGTLLDMKAAYYDLGKKGLYTYLYGCKGRAIVAALIAACTPVLDEDSVDLLRSVFDVLPRCAMRRMQLHMYMNETDRALFEQRVSPVLDNDGFTHRAKLTECLRTTDLSRIFSDGPQLLSAASVARRDIWGLWCKCFYGFQRRSVHLHVQDIIRPAISEMCLLRHELDIANMASELRGEDRRYFISRHIYSTQRADSAAEILRVIDHDPQSVLTMFTPDAVRAEVDPGAAPLEATVKNYRMNLYVRKRASAPLRRAWEDRTEVARCVASARNSNFDEIFDYIDYDEDAESYFADTDADFSDADDTEGGGSNEDDEDEDEENSESEEAESGGEYGEEESGEYEEEGDAEGDGSESEEAESGGEYGEEESGEYEDDEDVSEEEESDSREQGNGQERARRRLDFSNTRSFESIGGDEESEPVLSNTQSFESIGSDEESEPVLSNTQFFEPVGSDEESETGFRRQRRRLDTGPTVIGRIPGVGSTPTDDY